MPDTTAFGPRHDLTVLHGKFSTFLAWSQPFLFRLLRDLSEHVDTAVVCHETENLDRFHLPQIQRLARPAVRDPVRAVLAARLLRDRFDPNLLHAHFGWSAIRMLLLKQFLGIPMVTTFGGRDAFVQMHLPRFRDAYRLVLSASDAIVCVSEHLRATLLEAGVEADRLTVIRRGADLSSFAFVDRTERPAASPLRVLMVGRLVGKKGHRFALEAVHRLRKESLDVRLAIVGEGEEEDALRRLVRELGLEDAVSFEPPVDHAGVRARMEAADIFLHCSVTGADGDAEGIPNVVAEAAGTGLPIVGTEHGGITECIRAGVSGFIVKERDVDGLADSLRRLADQTLRLHMGRAARAFAEAELDARLQIEAHVELYRRLAASPRRGAAARSLPEEVGELLRYAVEDEAQVPFSISEKATELAARDEVLHAGLRDEPGWLARAYDLRRHVPDRLKQPVKQALRAAFDGLLALRYRRGRAPDGPQLERHLLRYFREGGELDALLAPGQAPTLGEARLLLASRLGGHAKG